MRVHPQIDLNIRELEQIFTDCGDFVGRKFPAGGKWMYIAYLDMMSDRAMIDQTVMSWLIRADWTKAQHSPADHWFDRLKDSGMLTADFEICDCIGEAAGALLGGDTALFMDGYDQALIISTKGFPGRGVSAADTEVVVQGAKEAFSESLRVNTALVRRRIRDPGLKIKQTKAGRRSQTDIAFLYVEDIVRPAILEEVERRVARIDIDAITDSGALEQLIEVNWLSPFPQAQLTERPDKAAAAILEGRIAVVVDNTPFVMIVPVTLNSFFQSSEDYYNRWQTMSLARVVRYAAALMAAALPGFYLAVDLFHPSMLPLLMITKMAEARQSAPLPAFAEVLIMDAAFELLREASVRLPAAAGGAIGIVGGLIIGQAAVEAGLASPIVVVIAALTGVSAFSIPSVALANGFRLIKYLIMGLSAAFGLLGFCVGMLFWLTHTASLRSFGVPYLSPYAGAKDASDLKDSLFRLPLFMMNKRPFFANPKQGRRMKSQ